MIETKQQIVKRILISLLVVFYAGLTFAQQETTIYGRVKNCENVDIHIKIQFFDPVTIQSSFAYKVRDGKDVKAEIGPDSSYVINTDKITQPYTSCIFLLGTQSTFILLSPGDSISIDLDCQTFETGIKFEGRGAGYNTYWQEIVQRFGELKRYLSFGEDNAKLRIDLLTDYRDNQQRIADKYLSSDEVDSSFFIWESKRIKYNYYRGLLDSYFWKSNQESVAIANIVEIVSDFDLNDEEAFLTIPEYRTLIRSKSNYFLRFDLLG